MKYYLALLFLSILMISAYAETESLTLNSTTLTANSTNSTASSAISLGDESPQQVGVFCQVYGTASSTSGSNIWIFGISHDGVNYTTAKQSDHKLILTLDSTTTNRVMIYAQWNIQGKTWIKLLETQSTSGANTTNNTINFLWKKSR